MTESKEAMQNTIKNLQAKSQHINKLEDKGNRSLVLQLGSHSIKMGFANDKTPFTLRPFIAYRKKAQQSPSTNTTTQPKESFDYEMFKTEYQKLDEQLKIEGIVAPDNRTLKGKPKAKQVVQLEKLQRVRLDSDILFGEDALWAENNPNYDFRTVITNGFLNVKGPNDFQDTINDLENILIHMLSEKLKIPGSEWKNFSCVIVLPDIFIRKHVKALVFSIFKRICFCKLYLHLESVLACFGSAINSACVVDIGHEKINVCCVDEGIIVPGTLIRKNFGLKNLSKSLCKIFAERINDKEIGELNFSSEADLNQIDKIKEVSTAIRDPDETINRVYEVNLIRKQNSIPFQVSYSDSICVASNSIFTSLWNSFETSNCYRKELNLHSQVFDLYEDQDDYLEQFSGGGHIFELNSENNFQELDERLFDPWDCCSIDEVIDGSLSAIKESEQRKRYMQNLFVIGGGGQMSKLTEEIVTKLNKKYSLASESDADNNPSALKTQPIDLAADFATREVLPVHSSWLGGTIIPKLDSLRDLWIERGRFLGEYNIVSAENEEVEGEEQQSFLNQKLFTRKEQSEQWGITYLKEKIPFVW